MRFSACIICLFLLCTGLPAAADNIASGTNAGEDPDGNVSAGLKTAQRWCSSCHDVTGHQAQVQPGIISFPQIARLKGVSMSSLIAIQSMPHIPMLDLDLSRQTKRDIAAYILTLRPR